jgi:glyoxylate reductase
MARVLISRRIPGEALERLAAAHEVEVWPERLPPPPERLRELVADAEGLLSMVTDRIDGELLDAAPRLRAIANYAVGTDNIDLEAAAERGIPVGNTPDVVTDATADLAWALMLALARRLPWGIADVLGGEWKTWEPERNLGADVTGATLGIVGYGRIGRAVARRAAGFDLRVLYTQRRRSDTGLGEYRGLDELLAESDIVTLHAPLTPETRGLIDARRLTLLRNDACFVNTARGEIVDEPALVRELASGRIRAGLDVFAHEPHVPEELLELPNVVLTPHLGSGTRQTREAMTRIVVDNILAFERGEPLRTSVQP